MSTMRMSGFLLVAALAVPASAFAQNAGPDLLIDVPGLARIMEEPELVLLHVGDRAEYDAAHIPGARYIELADISAPRSSDPNALVLELPDAAALRDRLQSLGISDGSRIVVYFGNDWVTPATRAILTLTWAGLGDQVRLLDGGMNAWRAAGHPVTDAAPPATTGTLSALRTRDVVVDAGWVREHLDRDGFQVVDARAPRFYEGAYEEQNGQRPGHIAGAVSVPFTEVVDDALRMKDVSALRSLFRQAGVEPSDTVVAYCHIGQQATAVVFAARLIGQPVVLYDGSYTEWGRNPELPIEKSAGGPGERISGDTGPAPSAADPEAVRSMPRFPASPLLSARRAFAAR